MDPTVAVAVIAFFGGLITLVVGRLLDKKIKHTVGEPNGEGNVITMLGTVLSESRAANSVAMDAVDKAKAAHALMEQHVIEDRVEFARAEADRRQIAEDLRQETARLATELEKSTAKQIAKALAAPA